MTRGLRAGQRLRVRIASDETTTTHITIVVCRRFKKKTAFIKMLFSQVVDTQ